MPVEVGAVRQEGGISDGVKDSGNGTERAPYEVGIEEQVVTEEGGKGGEGGREGGKAREGHEMKGKAKQGMC